MIARQIIIRALVLPFVKRIFLSYILDKSYKEIILKQARSTTLCPLELLYSDLCSFLQSITKTK